MAACLTNTDDLSGRVTKDGPGMGYKGPLSGGARPCGNVSKKKLLVERGAVRGGGGGESPQRKKGKKRLGQGAWVNM